MDRHRSLLLTALLFVGTTVLFSFVLHWPRSLFAGFDLSVALYLWWTLTRGRILMPDGRPKAALLDGDGRTSILVLSLMANVVVIAALVSEFTQAGGPKLGSALLTLPTVVLAWAFTHSLFAIHYAHRYYQTTSGERSLLFTGTAAPGFHDFVYLAFTIGATCATSDVAIGTRAMRTLVTVHATLSFFFNLFVLALAVSLIVPQS